VRQSFARSTQKASAVISATRMTTLMYGGTSLRTPFDKVAGLQDEEAMWPFVAGSGRQIMALPGGREPVDEPHVVSGLFKANLEALRPGHCPCALFLPKLLHEFFEWTS
jgi:hypothetical protein